MSFNGDTKEKFMTFKGKGNECFKNGNLNDALKHYKEAMTYATSDSDKVTIFKNKSAVYLKLNKYDKAIEETSKALDIFPNDTKALYRRSQALEFRNRLDEAYRDAKKILFLEPSNKEIKPVLNRLYEKIQELAQRNADVNVKITQMFDYVFNFKEEMGKRETAMNNILVLAGEKTGSYELCKAGVIKKVTDLLKLEKNIEMCLNGIRVVSELCKDNEDRTRDIILQLGIPWFIDILNSKNDSWVSTGQYCLQVVLNSLSGLTNKPNSTPNEELCERNRNQIDTILTCLVYACNSRTISAIARDAILQLITRNVHYKAINWAHQLIVIKGLQRLMDVASELPEYKYESSMNVTDSTKTLVSVCLARIYENMCYDKSRKEYLDNVNEFVKEKLLSPDIESKVRIIAAITVLLQGPLDIGNTIISMEGIMEMILVMAGMDDILQQRVACECIVAAVTKQDKAQSIVSKGINVLKQLYQSQNDGIRIRALVGLCKLGSSGGTDASIHPLADGSNKKLAEACRQFLITSKEKDVKLWAAEGLSFLTLDAEVKEMLIEDKAALTALINVGKDATMSGVYGVVATFVNLCNAYEKQEILPEMIELAKFAKRHIPEEHELDDEDFVTKRVITLGKNGITSALVALSKTESHNCKELISRVFNALCTQQELRGIVVQQGGVKILLSLSSEGTAHGMKQAAHALAKIAITINPEVAFPGERCIEIIRPLLALLLPECSGLMNFEALMALCNIASISEKVRLHVVKEHGLSKIESYMYEDHLMLRRAATQCITNLVTSPDVIKIYEGENDKFKFIYILCAEEDTETSKAAAGAVAMLTDVSEKCCAKIFLIKDWIEIAKQILAHPDKDVRHRGIVIAYNVICSNKENAEQLMNTEIMEILMALSILLDDEFAIVREIASKCLKKAEEMDVIKKNTSEK